MFTHIPLEGRTADPEALDYDEASDLFLQGIRLARGGDLAAGRPQIATAYLLDGRSINFCSVLPDPEAAGVAMDVKLLYELIQDDSFAAAVLRMAAARYMGHSPQGQMLIAGAMQEIAKLLKMIEQQPTLEADWRQGGVLGGCMKRTVLHFQRSSFHMAMGNHKKGIKDLTRALEIDPTYTEARGARASMWASLMLKEPPEVHAEYKRFVSEVHPDNRHLDAAYAWLALYTLRDPKLGTVAQAKQYYKQSLRAKARREELYGERTEEDCPPVLGLVRKSFSEFFAAPPEVREFREDADAAALAGDLERLEIPAALQAVPHPRPNPSLGHHKCLKCGKSALDMGNRKLSKCGKCKQISYCSRECQVSDWKDHKPFCKTTYQSRT